MRSTLSLVICAGLLGVPFLPSASAQVSAADNDPRFGVMTHFAQGWDPVWADIAAIRSITNVRDELYWNQIELQPGVYAFPASFDAYMKALQWDGISPLIELDFANPNYDGGQTPYTDEACAAYAAYGVQVLNHYGSQIKAVEIWNEYNGSFSSGPVTGDLPGSYTKMLAQAYTRIKTARPDVTVVGGATAGVPLPYWQALMADGALSSMDVLSIHPYQFNSAPEGIEQNVAALESLVLRYNGGVPKPIWVTEIGWNVQAGGNGSLAIDEATQAKFLVRAYALLLSAGVQRVFWYDLHDDPGETMGLTAPDATPRQSAYALQTMIGELQGAAFIQRDPSPSNLYSMLFIRPDGTQVRVMWALQPTTFDETGVDKIVDMTGNAVAFAGQLTLTDAPLFVEGWLSTLPPAAPVETLLTDSNLDFSGTQGHAGWWYGDYVAGTANFELLTNYAVTDWAPEWGGQYPYISISPTDVHPSVAGSQPVSVVRRWVGASAGAVHVIGKFQWEGGGGDGVGVTILVDGNPVVSRTLLGNRTLEQDFDFISSLQAGSTIDFVVDSGPGADINFDATMLQATISQSAP